MCRPILALFLLLFPLADIAAANPAISCHCFQERAYDPARPQMADPYLLATTQNTFMAVIFGLSKRDLVQAKMSGTSGDHLWVAHYLASEHGLSPASLLTARQRSGSWREVLHSVELGTLRAGEHFAALLQREAADPLLAAAVVDEILIENLAIEADDLARLRFRGADNAQIILAYLLADKSGRPVLAIHDDFANGHRTYGQMFDAQRLLPGAPLEEALRRLAHAGKVTGKAAR